MFNRHIQVKMVKAKNLPLEEPTDDGFAEDAVLLSKIAKDLMHEISKYVVGYILLDTLRQVAISLAERPKVTVAVQSPETEAE